MSENMNIVDLIDEMLKHTRDGKDNVIAEVKRTLDDHGGEVLNVFASKLSELESPPFVTPISLVKKLDAVHAEVGTDIRTGAEKVREEVKDLNRRIETLGEYFKSDFSALRTKTEDSWKGIDVRVDALVDGEQALRMKLSEQEKHFNNRIDDLQKVIEEQRRLIESLQVEITSRIEKAGAETREMVTRVEDSGRASLASAREEILANASRLDGRHQATVEVVNHLHKLLDSAKGPLGGKLFKTQEQEELLLKVLAYTQGKEPKSSVLSSVLSATQPITEQAKEDAAAAGSVDKTADAAGDKAIIGAILAALKEYSSSETGAIELAEEKIENVISNNRSREAIEKNLWNVKIWKKFDGLEEKNWKRIVSSSLGRS
ncbi:hypothetical protein [Pelobacter propionicus]|uniref:Uncharacterized protein n=1 Tax=Pelobacter propionicus (strain DSM 2379 / NBRC 103807 / OttBd1) TaxID=338966 RepID=A1AKC5_PELPD|nr:hypothetical protein [Pelobacter propionicus]ABK97795.1 hypothetical protein Ppro_0159 [Pelobacter propionicus DSM 2379]